MSFHGTMLDVPPPLTLWQLSCLLPVCSAWCLSCIFHNTSMRRGDPGDPQGVHVSETDRLKLYLQTVILVFMCVIPWMQHQVGPLLPDRLDSTAYLGSSLFVSNSPSPPFLCPLFLFPVSGPPLLLSLLLFSAVRIEQPKLAKMYTPGELGRRYGITGNT